MLTIFKKLGIMLWAFTIRLLKSLKEILVLIDQGVGLLICIPFYLLLGRPTPDADETISSIVGFYASHGYKWALVCEWIIDRLFYVFEGFKLGHCRKRIEEDEIDWEDIGNYEHDIPTLLKN